MALPSEYCVGCREASWAKVVTPTAFSAVGMLGFSTPECSPVTTAFWVYWPAGRLVSPLAAAQAWSSPISCWMLAAGSQPPVVQPIPGLVAVGNVESDSGAAPAAVPVSVKL